MRDSTLYLKDILAAIDSIERFTAGMDLETFQADDKTTSAVMRKLEIIGEAVKQIPDEIRQKHSQVPWKEMAGMREKLIHFYIWRRLPLGVESDSGATSSSQTRDSANSAGRGLTRACSRRRAAKRSGAAEAQAVIQRVPRDE